MAFIISQIFGGIALILVSIGYFMKSKKNFLIIQLIANIFYAGAFFALDAYVAAIITVISIFRCILLYVEDKKQRTVPIYWLAIFIVLYTITTIIFWKSPYDIIPLITGSMFTIGFNFKNLQAMRYFLIIPNILLVIYNILVSTYASAVLDFIELIAIIIAIIKFNIQNRKEQISQS